MRPPWEFEQPACAEVGTNLFFQPDRDDPEQAKMQDGEYKYGRKICETCPHLMECAEWGIANETHGLWGGLSPREREFMRKKRGIRLIPKVQSTQL